MKTRQGRKRADEILVVALACGATNEAAAKQAGVGESTVYRRLRDHQFCRKVHRARADIVERIAGTLTAASTEAVRTLLDLQKTNYPPAVRLGAARAILEMGGKLRENAELSERLATLEDQLNPSANEDVDA